MELLSLGRLALTTGAVAAASAATLLSPVSASADSFPLASESVFSAPSISSTSGSASLVISNPVTTGIIAPTVLNTNSSGLCAWTIVGGSNGRCSYDKGDPTVGIRGFSLAFDRPVKITGFTTAGLQNVVAGTVSFSRDNVVFSDYGFSTAGTVPVAFSARANEPVFVKTSAELPVGASSGVFRIASIDATPVPGPLPVLGGMAAFGFARRIRQRITAG
jgi:hypothetical protein